MFPRCGRHPRPWGVVVVSDQPVRLVSEEDEAIYRFAESHRVLLNVLGVGFVSTHRIYGNMAVVIIVSQLPTPLNVSEVGPVFPTRFRTIELRARRLRGHQALWFYARTESECRQLGTLVDGEVRP